MARRKLIGREKFIPPVVRVGSGWQLTLDVEERALIVRLMAELRALVEGPDDNALLSRLFPNAYIDDEEKEAEYQRLIREELVASRVQAIETVSGLLDPDPPGVLDAIWDEGQTIAFMQSINAIRLVLGALLGIDDDESADDAEVETSPEHQLYDFLSWLLEWTVRALSPGRSPRRDTTFSLSDFPFEDLHTHVRSCRFPSNHHGPEDPDARLARRDSFVTTSSLERRGGAVGDSGSDIGGCDRRTVDTARSAREPRKTGRRPSAVGGPRRRSRSGCAVGAGLAITGVVTGGLPLASGLAIAALLPAVLVDTQQRRLPDVWILDAAILLIVALGISWATGSSTSSPAAPIAGAVLMTAPLLLLHLVSPSAMGFGDVKLAVVLGAAVGALDWQLAIPALALAAGATATVGVVTRARTITFGPALLAGALVATLASDLLVTVTST